MSDGKNEILGFPDEDKGDIVRAYQQVEDGQITQVFVVRDGYAGRHAGRLGQEQNPSGVKKPGEALSTWTSRRYVTETMEGANRADLPPQVPIPGAPSLEQAVTSSAGAPPGPDFLSTLPDSAFDPAPPVAPRAPDETLAQGSSSRPSSRPGPTGRVPQHGKHADPKQREQIAGWGQVRVEYEQPDGSIEQVAVVRDGDGWNLDKVGGKPDNFESDGRGGYVTTRYVLESSEDGQRALADLARASGVAGVTQAYARERLGLKAEPDAQTGAEMAGTGDLGSTPAEASTPPTETGTGVAGSYQQGEPASPEQVEAEITRATTSGPVGGASLDDLFARAQQEFGAEVEVQGSPEALAAAGLGGYAQIEEADPEELAAAGGHQGPYATDSAGLTPADAQGPAPLPASAPLPEVPAPLPPPTGMPYDHGAGPTPEPKAPPAGDPGQPDFWDPDVLMGDAPVDPAGVELLAQVASDESGPHPAAIQEPEVTLVDAEVPGEAPYESGPHAAISPADSGAVPAVAAPGSVEAKLTGRIAPVETEGQPVPTHAADGRAYLQQPVEGRVTQRLEGVRGATEDPVDFDPARDIILLEDGENLSQEAQEQIRVANEAITAYNANRGRLAARAIELEASRETLDSVRVDLAGRASVPSGEVVIGDPADAATIRELRRFRRRFVFDNADGRIARLPPADDVEFPVGDYVVVDPESGEAIAIIPPQTNMGENGGKIAGLVGLVSGLAGAALGAVAAWFGYQGAQETPPAPRPPVAQVDVTDNDDQVRADQLRDLRKPNGEIGRARSRATAFERALDNALGVIGEERGSEYAFGDEPGVNDSEADAASKTEVDVTAGVRKVRELGRTEGLSRARLSEMTEQIQTRIIPGLQREIAEGRLEAVEIEKDYVFSGGLSDEFGREVSAMETAGLFLELTDAVSRHMGQTGYGQTARAITAAAYLGGDSVGLISADKIDQARVLFNETTGENFQFNRSAGKRKRWAKKLGSVDRGGAVTITDTYDVTVPESVAQVFGTRHAYIGAELGALLTVVGGNPDAIGTNGLDVHTLTATVHFDVSDGEDAGQNLRKQYEDVVMQAYGTATDYNLLRFASEEVGLNDNEVLTERALESTVRDYNRDHGLTGSKAIKVNRVDDIGLMAGEGTTLTSELDVLLPAGMATHNLGLRALGGDPLDQYIDLGRQVKAPNAEKVVGVMLQLGETYKGE